MTTEQKYNALTPEEQPMFVAFMEYMIAHPEAAPKDHNPEAWELLWQVFKL